MRPWDVVFLVGFALYIAIRGAYARRTKKNERDVYRAGAVDPFLIVIVFVGSLLLPVLYLATPWLAFADYREPAIGPDPWAAAPFFGVVAMTLGLWLFWRSHADLGLNWSVTIELRKGHELVTSGVYSVIRHPMYAAIWLFSLGQGLLLANWLAGWSACAAFAVMYFVRVPREERMMVEAFGDRYREYAARTGRILPRLFAARPPAPRAG